MYKIICFILAVSAVCAREIFYWDGSLGNAFVYDNALQYRDLNRHQKIAYLLSKYDVDIYSGQSRRPGKPDFFFVDYRGGSPTIAEMKRVPNEKKMNILFEP